MRKIYLILIAFMVLIACNESANKNDKSYGDIFLEEFDTPFGTPPFDKIVFEDYKPAFLKGMEQQTEEVKAIIENEEAPTFENTIVALDNSGQTLSRVSSVFYGLRSSNTNDDFNALAEELSPLLSEHSDNIYLNEDLFARIKAVHDNAENENLNVEQSRLLDEYYKSFVRSGIMLGGAEKDRLREINKELSAATMKFGNNLLSETNDYKLVIDNKDDLAGLPEGVIANAAAAATAAGEDGKWVFGLQKPSWLPFLQYADNRALRENLYKAMYMRGDNDNANDNKAVINTIVNLRIEKAHLLGFDSHAAFVLDDNMAKTPANAYNLLNEIWKYALPQAKKEAAELQKMIDAEGGNFKLASWDWWYYTEKLRAEKYSLSEEETRPYFKMENVRQGVFDVANKLYGISFKKLDNVAVYHPEVEVYEVLDKDGSHLAVLYTDYYPRESKNAGAWMSSFRGQQILDGKNIRPLIYNVGNFTKPTGDTPSLLTLDEVSTMFHEFGHALHGMFSNVTYSGLAGTSVSRDFVELPSQIMEHWAFHPDVIKLYAKHHQTGEVIPDSLIEKINRAANFNMGFNTTELVAAALLDMDYHTLTEKQDIDVREFEKNAMEKIGLIDEIIPRYRSTYFSHIFSGGYSAGYYAYLWAEVLDADAFQAFVENGIFDQTTANKFRENILSKGNSEEPMTLYKRFRGKDPDAKYLLQNRGFIK
ncbi:MAG: M3 family metallopeptidase [Fermentimonas sp.]|jgi:peptidyl-dipeptidase Dcp